jgi:hypothetical protein
MSSSPTTIIVGLRLRHSKVRRDHDWTSCHCPWLVSSHPLFGHWPGSHAGEANAVKLHLVSCALSAHLARRATKRIIVGCPLARSAAWCPVSKKDNMASAILRMVYRYINTEPISRPTINSTCTI